MAAGYSQRKMIDLVKRLIYATSKGDLQWEETDREHAYQAVVGSSTVLVASGDDDGVPPYEVAIFDDNGSRVDSIKSTYYRTSDDASSRHRTPAAWNSDLAELHERARRQAADIDRKVDELLDSLPAPPGPDDPPF